MGGMFSLEAVCAFLHSSGCVTPGTFCLNVSWNELVLPQVMYYLIAVVFLHFVTSTTWTSTARLCVVCCCELCVAVCYVLLQAVCYCGLCVAVSCSLLLLWVVCYCECVLLWVVCYCGCGLYITGCVTVSCVSLWVVSFESLWFVSCELWVTVMSYCELSCELWL